MQRYDVFRSHTIPLDWHLVYHIYGRKSPNPSHKYGSSAQKKDFYPKRLVCGIASFS